VHGHLPLRILTVPANSRGLSPDYDYRAGDPDLLRSRPRQALFTLRYVGARPVASALLVLDNAFRLYDRPANDYKWDYPYPYAAQVAAQRVLGAFAGDRDLDLSDLAERLAEEPEDVLSGLHVLDAMSLVTSEESGDGPRFHLRALPDEHVRFIGPNGRTQWLFVARPLDPPEIEAASLN